MASRLIFLHHLQSLNRRGRLWISWKADGCAYPGYRGARRGALKGTGDSGFARRAADSRGQEKPSGEIAGARTANRHR